VNSKNHEIDGHFFKPLDDDGMGKTAFVEWKSLCKHHKDWETPETEDTTPPNVSL